MIPQAHTARTSPCGTRKTCRECERWMSAEDAHKRCQKCRKGTGVRKRTITDEQRERYNARRREEWARLRA